MNAACIVWCLTAACTTLTWEDEPGVRLEWVAPADYDWVANGWEDIAAFRVGLGLSAEGPYMEIDCTKGGCGVPVCQ